MRFTVIMMNKLRFDAKGSNMRYRFLWKVFSVSFFFFFFFGRVQLQCQKEKKIRNKII